MEKRYLVEMAITIREGVLANDESIEEFVEKAMEKSNARADYIVAYEEKKRSD